MLLKRVYLKKTSVPQTSSRAQVIYLNMIFSKCITLIIFCILTASGFKIINNYADCFNGTELIAKTGICESIWDTKYVRYIIIK